jgi:hypothetical protein
VAVLGKEEALHAYLPRRAIVLSVEALSDFVNGLKSEDGKAVFSLPGVIRDFLKVGSSNLKALAEMNRARLDSHVVVGKDGKLKGVVDKSEILTQLLLGVAGIDQKARSVRLLFAITGLKTTTSDR